MIGLRVTWVPRDIEGWEWGDTGSNEFTNAKQNGVTELSEEQHTEYACVWSDREVSGRIVGTWDVTGSLIELDEPMCGLKYVAYPEEIAPKPRSDMPEALVAAAKAHRAWARQHYPKGHPMHPGSWEE